MGSPYEGLLPDKWLEVTKRLVSEHPLNVADITNVVLAAWESIFESRLGTRGFRIGREIFPKPQIMGFLLIPLELAARYPQNWCGERCASDKDVVYITDDRFSIR